jgi:coniferyl-aldehyde dehydrogenase
MNAVLTPITTHSTDAAEIERMRLVFDRQRSAFAAAPYPNLEARKAKLRKLIDALRRHQDAIVVAVNADFGIRAGAETKLVEVMGPILEARHALSHMRRWMKSRRRSTELLFLTNSAWVQYQPKGVVGIIGTWNFPLYLTIGPLVAARQRDRRVSSPEWARPGGTRWTLAGTALRPPHWRTHQGQRRPIVWRARAILRVPNWPDAGR